MANTSIPSAFGKVFNPNYALSALLSMAPNMPAHMPASIPDQTSMAQTLPGAVGNGPSRFSTGASMPNEFQNFVNAIKSQESGGKYSARGIPTTGGRAEGAYQIMDSNIPDWAKEALGHSVSVDQFLSNPALQDQIAQYKLRQYFDKYGVAGAAKAWYGGEGSYNKDSDAPQYGGPSINQYAQDILNRMAKMGGPSNGRYSTQPK